MSEKSLKDLIRAEDFKELAYAVLLKNNTSGTEIKDLSKILIDHFLDDGMILRVPPASCAVKHMVSLYLFELPIKKHIKGMPSSNNTQGSLELIGKVEQFVLDQKTKKHAAILLRFSQYDVTHWAELKKKYDERQRAINALVDINRK